MQSSSLRSRASARPLFPRPLLLLPGMLLCAAAASTASGQSLRGEWKPTFGSGPHRNVNASIVFDFDGAGPDPAVPVTATTGPNPSVLALRNGQWITLGESFNAIDNFALASHDPDGDGPMPPQLIVGNNGAAINSMPPRTINRIARWDGSTWQPMASGFAGTVYALISFDPDGNGPLPSRLFAGGTIGGVAEWNGAAWQMRSNGLEGTVYAFTSFDPDGDGPELPQLIAGGTFGVGPVPSNPQGRNVARWNGTSWVPVGAGLLGNGFTHTGVVSVLSAHDFDGNGPQPPQLIAGGTFTSISGGPAARYIARWDGAAWSAIGNGTGTLVRGLASYDPDGPGPQPSQLIAGGSTQIKRWDGLAWQTLGSGLTGDLSSGYGMMSLTPYTPDPSDGGPPGTRLLVAGEFKAAGGQVADHVAQWDGTNWSSVARGPASPLGAATLFDTDGSGPLPRQIVALSDGVKRWDGATWQPMQNGLGGPMQDRVIGLMTLDTDGSGPQPTRLLGRGRATSSTTPEEEIDTFFAWNGSAWQRLPGEFGGVSLALRLLSFDADGSGPDDGQLIAVGDFTIIDAVSKRRIARLDGSTWQQMGGTLSGDIRSTVVFDPDGSGPLPGQLVIGGQFLTSGSAAVNYVARWDGTAWQPLGGGTNSHVTGLIIFDTDGAGPLPPQLIAQGSFTTAGGAPASNFARWDGTQWHAMGDSLGLTSALWDVYDSDGPGPLPAKLIAAGTYAAPGGNAIRIISWDGAAWQSIAEGANSIVRSIRTFDIDGDGPQPPQLLVSGSFTTIGGQPARNLARWDGTSWHEVGNGFSGGWAGGYLAYTPSGETTPRLVAAGLIDHAGGTGVPYMTLLEPYAGPADFGSTGGLPGSDGTLDNNDFIAFINAFFEQDPRADLGRAGGEHGPDGLFDNNDFIVFIDLYFQG